MPCDNLTYNVTAVYEGFRETTEQAIREAAGRSHGSGFGLGERDHGWYNLPKTKAQKLVKALRVIRGVKVTMYRTCDSGGVT